MSTKKAIHYLILIAIIAATYIFPAPEGLTNIGWHLAGIYIATPIAPHNLNARPLVIPEDTEVKLTVSGREKKFLMSLDSHIKPIANKHSIIVRKAPFVVKMIRLDGDSFINTLRYKLLWGEDRRNK